MWNKFKHFTMGAQLFLMAAILLIDFCLLAFGEPASRVVVMLLWLPFFAAVGMYLLLGFVYDKIDGVR